MSQPHISIILPVYRTARSLPELHERLVTALRTTGHSFELIFVNDGSDDDASDVLCRVAKGDSSVKVLHLTRNFGQHPATAAGLDYARGQLIAIMDTDLQDPPEELPRLIEALDDDSIDAVYTVSAGEPSSWCTRFTSRLFHNTFSRISRTTVPNNIGTYRMFRSNVLKALQSFSERTIVYGPLMLFMGFPSTTIQIHHAERPYGSSAYSFLKRISLAADVLISYTDIPYKLTCYAGLTMLLSSVVYSLMLIIQYAIVGRILPPGRAVLTLLTTVFTGLLMLGIGSIGAYTFRIYQEVLARPRYLVYRQHNISMEDRADDYITPKRRVA